VRWNEIMKNPQGINKGRKPEEKKVFVRTDNKIPGINK
jgi:hypothetical protein